MAGCSKEPESQAHELLAAMQLAKEQPVRAARRCPTFTDPQDRASCVWAVVTELAPVDDAAAHALCDSLQEFQKDECRFKIAEALESLDACDRTGAYEDHCRRHLIGPALAQWMPDSLHPGQFEEAVLKRSKELSRPDIDENTWLELYRKVLGEGPAIDGRRCDAAPTEVLQGHCRTAALAMYTDAIHNTARRGRLDCEGPLSPKLRRMTDPVFLEQVAIWRADGRCGPDAAAKLEWPTPSP